MIIDGVALEPGVETLGSSGVEKVWPEEELREAAVTLSDKAIVAGADDTDTTIGRVIGSSYKDGVGVVYQAAIWPDDIANKIDVGLVELAPACTHNKIDETGDGPFTVTNITFNYLFATANAASGVPPIDGWTVLERKA